MNKNRRPGGKENSMKDSIKALRELEKRLYAYQYAMAVADYDSETVARRKAVRAAPKPWRC